MPRVTETRDQPTPTTGAAECQARGWAGGNGGAGLGAMVLTVVIDREGRQGYVDSTVSSPVWGSWAGQGKGPRLMEWGAGVARE
ncbi:unnamed protein product [Boreogadus saida]